MFVAIEGQRAVGKSAALAELAELGFHIAKYSRDDRRITYQWDDVISDYNDWAEVRPYQFWFNDRFHLTEYVMRKAEHHLPEHYDVQMFAKTEGYNNVVKHLGMTIVLKCDEAVRFGRLVKAVRGDERNAKFVRQLWQEVSWHFADVVIDTTDRSPKEVAMSILAAVQAEDGMRTMREIDLRGGRLI